MASHSGNSPASSANSNEDYMDIDDIIPQSQDGDRGSPERPERAAGLAEDAEKFV